MTDTQVLQVLGLVYFSAGIGLLLSPKLSERMLKEYSESSALLFLSGILAIVVGYLLVAFRASWDTDLRSIIVTAVGWLALAKWVLLIAFPDWMMSVSKQIVRSKGLLAFYPAVVLLLGILTLWLGFFSK